MNKKLYIKTYGCQMNVYDSARMADVMAPLGYALAEEANDADMVILNTCHIREKAEEKVYSDLGRLRSFKTAKEQAGGKMLIAVGGCVGQAEGEEITRRAPYVDMVFGPQSYHHLPDMVARAVRDGGGVVDIDFSIEPKFDFLPENSAAQGPSAFLSVQEGCDKFCTFCVVPYTRGAEYSRDVASVVAEAKKLAGQGTREITLLGQNVNAYHGKDQKGDDCSLGQLIQRLANIDGIERLFYMTSHPRDMDDSLITAHRDVPELMPFLHLPVQSGSNKILAKMNRKHTAAEYLEILEKLRVARPDIALSSDFIVGFPGETDEDFEDTLKLVETVGYAQCYSFKYSPRPGTPAAEDEKQLPEEVKTERLARLQKLITSQQIRFNEATIGKTMPVLFTREGKHTGQLIGKTPYMQSVYVDEASSLNSSIVNVLITRAFQNSVTGRIVDQELLNCHSRGGGNLKAVG